MIAPLSEAVTPVTPATAADDDDVILSVHGVSKHYKLWSSPSVRLRYSILSQAHRTLRQVLPKQSAPLRFLQRRRERLYRDFTALHELSFEVRRGESLGIIGRNGAGKSTLLQLIAGTLRPSTGRVDVYGRVAALLELGSSFNPEFSGRENVYLNASILGFTEAETNEKFDRIAGFADIGQFLEQPVKTYSSGMMLRLAFSVQMALDPAIFIIDEALSVGDIYFQLDFVQFGNRSGWVNCRSSPTKVSSCHVYTTRRSRGCLCSLLLPFYSSKLATRASLALRHVACPGQPRSYRRVAGHGAGSGCAVSKLPSPAQPSTLVGTGSGWYFAAPAGCRVRADRPTDPRFG